MKKVYICSPYRGDGRASIDFNVAVAKALGRDAVMRGVAPYIPHLMLPHFLSDSVVVERQKAINIGSEFLRICDELWFYHHNGISNGMQHEISLAQELRIEVVKAWPVAVPVGK